MLKRLWKKGWLGRRQDPADERSVIVELTKKGESLQHQAKCIPEDKTLKLQEKESGKMKATLDNLMQQIA